MRKRFPKAFSLGLSVVLATVMAVEGCGPGSSAWATPSAKTPGLGGEIVFNRLRPTSQDPGNADVYVVNANGSHERLLFPSAAVARWSPNGNEVALNASLNNPCPPCASSTVIINPDTGNYLKAGSYLVFPPADPKLSINCSIWSHNGKLLACDATEDAAPSRNGLYTIQTSDGRGLTRLTSNPGGEDIPIAYSPDGKQIVFGRTDPTRLNIGDQNKALFIVNTDDSGLRRITPWGYSDDDGGWSRDGAVILFEDQGSLDTVHPDGTGLATILHDGFDAGWSPDGTRIVFSRFLTGTSLASIYTANVDGSDVRAVTKSPSRDDKADWGPRLQAT